MGMFNNLRDHLLKDRPGETAGQRAEVMITLLLGTLLTLLLLLAYRTPTAIITLWIANVIAFFTLYQAFRARYNYLIFYSVVTTLAICIVTISEGTGTHDLLWTGILGLFLLANMHSRKGVLVPISLAVLMVGIFAATGTAEIYELLPNQFGTDAQYIYRSSFFFAMMMTAISVIFNRHHSLLQTIVENKSTEIKSNLELQEINQALENRVELRTRELREANAQIQKRTARLQAITEISQEISSSLEQRPDELLDRITRIIGEKLDFYHVGIFLLDENRQYAVLRAANSQGGQRMLERRHQMRVGGTGIVGYVSQGGRARIALDTGSDAVFFNNPDLPTTRSEMAIPLKYGQQVIGVLDLQSVMPSAFSDEDAGLLGTLANQIAIAINNILINEQARLKGGTRNKISQRISQPDHRQKQNGYSFNTDGTISAATPVSDPGLEKALSTGETVTRSQQSENSHPTLTVPVKFRDQVIGVIHIEATEANRKWTEDEITVVQSISDRAAFALENARLFEETSRRVKQEETIAHITSQIGASTNFDRILQTTVEELGRTLGSTRSFIQLAAPANNEDENTPVN